MRADWKLGLVSAVSAGAIVALVVAACLPDPDRPPSGGGPVGALPCDGGGPGNFPAPNCDNTTNTCPAAIDPSCVIDPKCGSTKTCMPMADNSTSKTWDLRIRRLFATAPAALTNLQKLIVDPGINLPPSLNCGDKQGTGSFNWLLRIDPTAKTLMTGGAPPSSDPFGVGYCFYQATTPLKVGPASTSLTFDTPTTFSSGQIDKLPVPIFIGDVNSVVILPLSKAVVKNVTISPDGNCIGQFNAPAVGAGCADEDPDSCARWHTAGDIGGYMTLEDADSVFVSQLNESLCVVLTATTKDANGKCKRDGGGKIAASGDYCSTTQSAGGCADSFWLSATFAASAAKINDGAGIVGCGVAPTPDAGTDSGSDSGSNDSGASDATTD